MTSPAPDPPVSFEGEMAAAIRAGRAAFRAGRPRSVNPHRADAATPAERVLARMWLAGWSDANPIRSDPGRQTPE